MMPSPASGPKRPTPWLNASPNSQPAGPEFDQAAKDTASINRIFDLLEARIQIEADPVTRGVIFRTIGRLVYPDESSYRQAEKVFLPSAAEAAPSPLLGSLWRGQGNGSAPSTEAEAYSRPMKPSSFGLKSMALSKPAEGRGAEAVEESARFRRLALMALTWAGRLDEATLEAALSDPDEQVRRLVFFGWGRMGTGAVSPNAAERLIGRGLADLQSRFAGKPCACSGGRGSTAFPPPLSRASTIPRLTSPFWPSTSSGK
ncbi:MAG: hypothetical protein MZV70_69120 [Desulfobacterales bacterium]|nr:hypothetical protein [Desulfobacterales bacterium]